jgi:glycosyltransferase involved in cell wall biosynthesis
VTAGSSTGPIRVCLDARLVSGEYGGIEQFILGLAHGLSRLPQSADEYLFLVDKGASSWLQPYLGGSCRLLLTDRSASRGFSGFAARQRGRVGRRLTRLLGNDAAGLRPSLAPQDAAVGRAAPDAMHFTMQIGFRTGIPSVYQPWDLQHLHLPDFFTPQAIAYREFSYRALCEQASLVAVMSSWVRRDLIDKFSLPEDKVRTVPLAPVLDAYREPVQADLLATRARLDLPDRFAIYPAKAWPHKNHLRLLEALRILREERGLVVPVVFTGAQNGLDIPVLEAAAGLGLTGQVRFTGFLDSADLRAIYALARMLVFPTLFEGLGMPVLEAFTASLPVACSNVTCLPDLAANSARLFDPMDPSAIADAVGEVWADEALRARLSADGLARARMFSWDDTARTFRAHYRRLAGRRLTREDDELLAAAPLV